MQRIKEMQAALAAIDKQVHPDLYRAFLLDAFFSLAGACQVSWIPFNGHKGIEFSSSFFTMAVSGAGKNRAEGMVNSFFSQAHGVIKDRATLLIGQYNHGKEAEAEVKFPLEKEASKRNRWIDENSLKRFNRSNSGVSSPQGIANALNTMRVVGVGAYRHTIDECAKWILSTSPTKVDFLDSILAFSGGGLSQIGRTLKDGAIELDATGVAINLHFFGNDSSFSVDDKKLERLRDFLRDGFARRCFFTSIVSLPSVTVDDLLKPSLMPEQTGYMEWIQSLANDWLNKRAIGFNQQAATLQREIATFMVDCRKRTGNAIADADRGDHGFKAQKLACLFALINRNEYVTASDWRDAVAFVQESAQQYLQLMGAVEDKVYSKLDSWGEQMATLLKGASEPLNTRQLSRGLSPVPRSTTELPQIINEASESLFTDGFEVVTTRTKNGRGVLYSVRPLQAPETLEVSFSVADSQEQTCTKYHTARATLEDLAWIALSGNYSPHTFKDEYRRSASWQEASCLVYDIDAGMNMEETKETLNGIACAVVPTKSHQKLKNGVVSDRFRVFIPLSTSITAADGEATYKAVYSNVGTALGLEFDAACKDTARFYFSGDANYEPWFSSAGSSVLDWRQFRTSAAPPVVKRIELPLVAAGAKDPKALAMKGATTLLSRNWTQGARNVLAFRTACWLKDSGHSIEEARAILEHGGNGDPLPILELQSVLKSAFKK